MRNAGLQDVRLLHVPSERDALESMEQRDHPAVPVGVMQVDCVDALFSRGSRRGARGLPSSATTGSSRPAWRPGRAAAAGSPTAGAHSHTRSSIAGAASATTSITDLPAGRILEVERQVVVGSAALDQLGERRDVAGQRRPLQLADRPVSPERPLDDAVVVEHRHAVGGDPDVALQTVGTQLEGQLEPRQGVLRGVSPGAAVAEGDGLVEERGEALLHP